MLSGPSSNKLGQAMGEAKKCEEREIVVDDASEMVEDLMLVLYAQWACPCDPLVLMFPLRDCCRFPLPRPRCPLLGSFCRCFRHMESVILLVGVLDHLVGVLQVSCCSGGN